MLALTLVCIGRTRAGLERDLTSRYVERARLAGRPLGLIIDVREIAESRAKRSADRRLEEARAIHGVLGSSMAQTFVLDEAGESIDSESFAAAVRSALEQGDRTLALVIGGPDGLDPSLRDSAAKVIAFGAMTWPHQLVRIMAAEQIYRAVTILSGHPYHRA